MKITNIFLGLFLLLSANQLAFGQKQEKIYYDQEWNGCSQSKASFYRIVNYDENGKPVGKILDYFISGELQSDIEGSISIDKLDDDKSVFVGKSIGYYKSGKKSFENIKDQSGEFISNTHWYEGGNLKFTSSYKEGKLHGEYISYYENGKIKLKAEYVDGNLKDKWFIECDEFEKCEKVFFEWFRTGENENEWNLFNEDEYKSKILKEKGLLVSSSSKSGFGQWINLPIDITNNFSIETIIEFKSGEKNSAQGLIWGQKDWDNYFYFYINASGSCHIGAKSDGLSLDFVKWRESDYINKDYARNLIKVSKINDKVYYSINSKIVATEDFYTFRGNKIGFFTSGKKEVIFERLLVRETIEGNGIVSKFGSSHWKGNGSGFFIDGKGYILTNYHVVEDASEIEVDLIQEGQKTSYKAKVITSDKQNDLAVIKIDDNNFKPYLNLPYNFKTQISDVGTMVFALGYPMLSILGDEVKFTDGKISSKTGFQGDITTYQISVPVQPGNSGGPLFDYDGNLVGVINAKIMKADNVSYAIKTSYAKNLIDVLPETILTPSDITLAAKPLTEKIKALSDYVVLIKVR